MHQPLVSVLLPAHRNNPFFQTAINSILTQTLTDFELLILDNSAEGLQEFILTTDLRLKHISVNPKFGLSETLNYGINLALGKYIARMDYDDISLPSRLELQVDYLESHPNVGALGTFIRIIEDSANAMAEAHIVKRPVEKSEIQEFLLYGNPLFHPTVMFNAKILKSTNMQYRKKFDTCEDLDLWSRIIRKSEIANLPIPLLDYRHHQNQFSRIAGDLTEYYACLIRIKYAIRSLSDSNIRPKAFKALVRNALIFPRRYLKKIKFGVFQKF